MSVVSRAGVLPKALVATLVGCVAGGIAGVWSLRQPPAAVNVSAAAAPPVAATPRTGDDAASTRSPSVAKRAAPATDDDASVAERARTLARRPDVTALMALRDEVARRAADRGTAGASSVKRQLDDIDVRLNEARMLQLKLDAEELRKAN